MFEQCLVMQSKNEQKFFSGSNFSKISKIFYGISYFVNSNQWSRVQWSYGVMAITLDFESNNPSSNLGRTSLFSSTSSFYQTDYG